MVSINKQAKKKPKFLFNIQSLGSNGISLFALLHTYTHIHTLCLERNPLYKAHPVFLSLTLLLNDLARWGFLAYFAGTIPTNAGIVLARCISKRL